MLLSLLGVIDHSRNPGRVSLPLHDGRVNRRFFLMNDVIRWRSLRSIKSAFAELRQPTYNEAADRVLQSEILPELKPFKNQRLRCAEVPWVNASGTT